MCAIGEKTLTELRNSFLAPLDREDIYLISRKMCDIADSQRGVLERIALFPIHTVEKEDKELAGHILQSSQTLILVFNELPKLKKHADKVDDWCNKIIKISRKSATLYRQETGKLFMQNVSGETLKRHDLLTQMEKVQELYVNLAILLRGVVMKYA